MRHGPAKTAAKTEPSPNRVRRTVTDSDREDSGLSGHNLIFAFTEGVSHYVSRPGLSSHTRRSVAAIGAALLIAFSAAYPAQYLYADGGNNNGQGSNGQNNSGSD